MTPDSEAGPDEPRTNALTTKWLDSWPDGATYTFNRAQIETVIAGVRNELRERVAGLPDAIVNRLPPSGLIERAAVLALFDEPESQP